MSSNFPFGSANIQARNFNQGFLADQIGGSFIAPRPRFPVSRMIPPFFGGNRPSSITLSNFSSGFLLEQIGGIIPGFIAIPARSLRNFT